MVVMAAASSLEQRLTRGAQLLFDMEQRGETGGDYDVWRERWESMLHQYELQHDRPLSPQM